MRVSTRLLGLGLLISACEAPPLIERGGTCHSLSDCDLGLTCVEGRCSDDLSRLRGEVPSYEMGDGGAAMEAGVDAEAGVVLDAQIADTGAPRPDAAPDAAGPRDTGMPDTAPPLPEASAPDTSVPEAGPEASTSDAESDAESVADAAGD